MIRPEDEVIWSLFAKMIDYELEWTAVIGREGRQVKRAQARGYIFGYSIYNDRSTRGK